MGLLMDGSSLAGRSVRRPGGTDVAGCFDRWGKIEHCYGALPAAERAARRRSDAEQGRPYKSPPYG
ncbi:hypothetical protein SAMN06272775_7055 [Streptomyces sp. 2323.1]|nr:hypothetical protein SAMN06272775_7055 [Streptomyces sp. 2323.1]